MARSMFVREAREEIEAAWQAALAAVERAEEQDKQLIGIQWMKADPGYRLLAIDESAADIVRRTCFRFDGFSREDWASNLVYALKADCCFSHARADDIDDFFCKIGIEEIVSHI